jgi:hypothetical protein
LLTFLVPLPSCFEDYRFYFPLCVRLLAHYRFGKAQERSRSVFLKGLRGSTDAVYAAAMCHITESSHIFIMHNKEESSFFLSDLSNLMQRR